MKAERRRFLAYGSTALLSACAPGRSSNPDVTFIIPYAPGGGFDSYVRAVIPALQKSLGALVIPQNVDGAGGAQAAQEIHRAKPDGSIISIVNIPGAMILREQGGLDFDLQKLSWIANMGRDAYALLVPATSAIHSVDHLRALGHQRPVKFTCVGAAGTAYSATKIGTRLLGVRSQIITGYKGTNDYIVAAVRGDGDAAIASLASVNSYLKAKAVRVLCTFEKTGSLPGVPDATTLGLPDLVDIAQFRPIAGPPGMPAPIIERLSKAFISALRQPSVVEWAARNHANLTPDDPAETMRILQNQAQFVTRWKNQLAVA